MRSWPACVCTSEAYFAGCCSALMWSILILMPVSLVKRWPISDSFLSESGAKLFQHRYETSRCWPRADGTPVARMPARPVPAVVVRKRRRVIVAMIPPLSFGSTGRPCRRPWVRLVSGQLECAWERSSNITRAWESTPPDGESEEGHQHSIPAGESHSDDIIPQLPTSVSAPKLSGNQGFAPHRQ